MLRAHMQGQDCVFQLQQTVQADLQVATMPGRLWTSSSRSELAAGSGYGRLPCSMASVLIIRAAWLASSKTAHLDLPQHVAAVAVRARVSWLVWVVLRAGLRSEQCQAAGRACSKATRLQQVDAALALAIRACNVHIAVREVATRSLSSAQWLGLDINDSPGASS